jgi:Signal peptide binding domain
MIPGLPTELLQGSDEEGSLRMKRMIYITDSMTAAELDSDGALFMEYGKDGKPTDITWRVTRVAKGSGTSVREVEEVLCQYRMMANMAKQAGGKNGWYVMTFLWLFYIGDSFTTAGCKLCKKCRQLQAERVAGLAECLRPPKYKLCRQVLFDKLRTNVSDRAVIEIYASRDATEHATSNERRRNGRDDESHDARTRRRSSRHGRNAA